MSDFENCDDIRDELRTVWKKILEDIKNDPDFEELKEIMGWLETVMESNVPFGKQNRAVAIAVVYRNLVAQAERTPEMDFCVGAIGWISEILHTSALIVDDIMDESLVRRGKPAWYTRADVGLSAINDALLLENITWRILRKYFYTTGFYEQLLFLIQDTALVTILGQTLDTRFSIRPDFTKFTRASYDTIVKYKTSLYSFYTPVAVAMILGGITDKSVFEGVKCILVQLGRLFQIQDDYLDLYGDSKVTGKVGTDIVDGKCSWMIVEALERASLEQKAVLLDCYGSKKIDNVQKVQGIYKALNLKRVFQRYEVKTYDSIRKSIDDFEVEPLRKPLKSLLSGIYKRQK